MEQVVIKFAQGLVMVQQLVRVVELLEELKAVQA